MRKRPTLKQRLFVQEYVKNGGNGVQAAAKTSNGKNYNTLKTYAKKSLRSPIVQEEIEKLLNEAGLSRRSTIRKLSLAADRGLQEGKATVSDALRAIDMSLRLHNLYPERVTKRLSYSVQKHLSNADYKDNKNLLKDLTQKSSKLLEEAP